MQRQNRTGCLTCCRTCRMRCIPSSMLQHRSNLQRRTRAIWRRRRQRERCAGTKEALLCPCWVRPALEWIGEHPSCLIRSSRIQMRVFVDGNGCLPDGVVIVEMDGQPERSACRKPRLCGRPDRGLRRHLHRLLKGGAPVTSRINDSR